MTKPLMTSQLNTEGKILDTATCPDKNHPDQRDDAIDYA